MASNPYGKTLAEWARELGLHPATFFRWCKVGCRDPRGYPVKPVYTKLGGRIYIRESDMNDFFAALKDGGPDPATEIRTPCERSREAERAGHELDRIGIGK